MSLFTITVRSPQCAVEYHDGIPSRVLPAGRHRRRRRTSYRLVDLGETLLSLSPQEVLTGDGLQVRVTAAVRYRVADPIAYVERAAEPETLVYLAAQVALRDALAGLTSEDLTRRGAALPVARLRDAVDAVARTVGIEVGEVVVKDVILPAEVRAAAAELVTARSRGAAQLEAARAETAALRSLANAAKLLDAHPALAQLRLVQAAPYGSQLVLRVGAAETTGPTVG
jgi:regulator of protease activity HflC (stomatin/prohibitin superfamily)